MKVQDIYFRLEHAGFAKSQVQFSEIWLGRSKRYYSHLIATGREPGLATLTALEWRLRQQAAMVSGAEDQQYLLAMSDQLQSSIQKRSLIELRHRRASSE